MTSLSNKNTVKFGNLNESRFTFLKNKNMKHVVVSLSGGMDSSTLLLRCLKEYDTVTALSFDYGQKHRVELERAQSLVDYIKIIYDLLLKV
jgi:7-cyano-7-deazaguanine synthase in queuosine biosynthesis